MSNSVYQYDFQKPREEEEDEENLLSSDIRKEKSFPSANFKNQSSSCQHYGGFQKIFKHASLKSDFLVYK